MATTKSSPPIENVLNSRLAALYERRSAIDQLIRSLQAYQRADGRWGPVRPPSNAMDSRYPARRLSV